MALWQERYEIEVKINNEILDYPPSAYSFTMFDSIYNFYSKGSFIFNDSTNYFSEFLTFANGLKIDITFGPKESPISCPYTIVRNSMPQQIAQSNMGGMVEIPLIHNYFSMQNNLSEGFKAQEVAKIIEKKIQEFPFTTKLIKTTQTKGNWYQPLVNNATFINEYLLPFAYSNDASHSPFYAFIDSANGFNFCSYKSMFDEKPVMDLVLTSTAQLQSLMKDSISSINFTQESLASLRPLINRLHYNYDKTGALVSKADSLLDYPDNRKNTIVLFADKANVTSHLHLLDDDIIDKEIVNKNNGLLVNTMKQAFHIEKVIISTNLNTSLIAGKKVNLMLPVRTDAEKSELSNRYSGEYLIESSYHKWNGHFGTTVLVCSKQGTELPNNYINKKVLIK